MHTFDKMILIFKVTTNIIILFKEYFLQIFYEVQIFVRSNNMDHDLFLCLKVQVQASNKRIKRKKKMKVLIYQPCKCVHVYARKKMRILQKLSILA